MNNTITPNVAPVRFEVTGANSDLFTLYIDGDVLGTDVEDALLNAVEPFKSAMINLEVLSKEKGKQLSVNYNKTTDILDIGDWALVVADGVKITFEITGNAPEENNMNTEELLSPTSALTEHPVTEEKVQSTCDKGEIESAKYSETEGIVATAVGCLSSPQEMTEIVISIEEPTYVEAINEEAPTTNQSSFPPTVETQKEVMLGINPSESVITSSFNPEAAREAFNKKWNAQPLKTPKPVNSKPADAGRLSQLVKEGVGSKAKKKAPLRQVVQSTKEAEQYLASAIRDFNQQGEDGVDFINTSAIAETRLGKFLDINAHVPFAYQNIGEFASVGAFWYFISAETPDDSLRSLHGTAARNARYRVRSRPIEGFRTLIADATWAKINSDRNLAKAVIDNNLKYMCFYKQADSPLNVQSPVASWYMWVLEEIAATLKEMDATGNANLVPNFTFLDAPRPPKGRRYS